jgi:hypothetical protein
MVRPSYLVGVFAFQTHCAINSALGTNATISTVRGYRTEQDQRARYNCAAFLRELRRYGLQAADVRRIALHLIDAPESYAGVIRSQRRDEVRRMILTFGTTETVEA